MASFVLEGVDELIYELERIGDIDEVSFKIVEEAAEVMDEELKQAIILNTQKYGTGALAASINHIKPRRNLWGVFTASTARGKDDRRGRYKKVVHASFNKKTGEYVGTRSSYGTGAIRNHDKLYYLEYGNSRQDARPFVQKCVNSAEPKVLEKMQEVFNRETGR